MAAEPSDLLAFPTAEGYGRFAQGGRGGDVYHVTNLDDSGPGSLREGIESTKSPRTIVFETGGTIDLKTPLEVDRKSRLTLAGQTSPGDGITLKGNTLKFKNSSHLIVRYLRVRLGDENKEIGGADAMSVNDCDHAIFDHLSVSWGIDGNQDIRQCKNYTFQWCILSEALNESLHKKGSHAMCGSFRAPLGNLSIHHNLFATSRDRHPTIGGAVKEPEWILDFRNNVIYNWSGTANVCDNPVNLVNNYFRPGPETPLDEQPIALKPDLPDKARGHMSGNLFEQRQDFTSNNYAALDMKRWLHSESKYQFDGTLDDWSVEEPYDLGANTPKTQSAEEAYALVLAHAGASLVRDDVDIRLIEDVKERQGRLIDSQSEVGGYPNLDKGMAPTDTDRDGAPDEWETSYGLDPNDPEDRNGDQDGDGYTNLEEYLEDRRGDHAWIPNP
jgi:pectate lyase